jgi:hypothetical protein
MSWSPQPEPADAEKEESADQNPQKVIERKVESDWTVNSDGTNQNPSCQGN